MSRGKADVISEIRVAIEHDLKVRLVMYDNKVIVRRPKRIVWMAGEDCLICYGEPPIQISHIKRAYIMFIQAAPYNIRDAMREDDGAQGEGGPDHAA